MTPLAHIPTVRRPTMLGEMFKPVKATRPPRKKSWSAPFATTVSRYQVSPETLLTSQARLIIIIKQLMPVYETW